MAVASFILGILSLVTLLPGPVAVWLGWMARRRILRRGPPYRGRNLAWIGIGTGCVGTALLVAGLGIAGVMAGKRRLADRSGPECERRLRRLGEAAVAFAREHSGRMPPGFDVLTNTIASSNGFWCPADGRAHRWAPGERIDPRTLSYQLLVPNRKDPGSDVVLARCPTHHLELRVDGSVRHRGW